MQAAPLKTIAKYQLLEELGSGASGIVYRARDMVLERDVALKTLNVSSELRPDIKERFYREARAAAQLHHENIVSIYDLSESNGIVYIAMELLLGADMKKYIVRAQASRDPSSYATASALDNLRPLVLVEKIELIAQVCDGLAEAHKNGIIHRDIKPANIFIERGTRAKVLDFGVARLPTSKLTVPGTAIGTPNYFAPEQLESSTYDCRYDIFSTGIVAYEFFVGAHPFQATFIPFRIQKDDPDSILNYDPLIPQSLERLLQEALQKRPDERIQTAREFADRLRAVANEVRGTPVSRPAIVDLAPDPRSQGEEPDFTTRRQPVSSLVQSEDSGQQRVAEFIRVLSEFEASITLNDISAATEVLEKMRRLAALDDRFKGAFDESRNRLNEIAPPAPPPPGPLNPDISPPPPVPPRPPDPADTTKVSPSWLARLLQTIQGSFARITNRPGPARSPVYTWIGGGAIAFVLIGFFGASGWLGYHSRPVPAERAVGQASVRIPSTDLIAAPDRGDQRLMTFVQGTQVNVLERISSRDQHWVRAQYVSREKNSRPGYLRISDLGQLTSDDPAVAWGFLALSRPTSGAKEAEIRGFIDALQMFRDRFPVSPQAWDADLERMRLQIAVVKQNRDAGAPTARWQQELSIAKQALFTIDPQHTHTNEIAPLQKELEALDSPVLVGAAPQSPLSKQVAAIEAKIYWYWNKGELKAILDLVRQIEELDKNNDRARYWRAKVADVEKNLEELKQDE